ncbi:hypothetical protein K6858_003695 [Vibrio parahaemolyticus]|nr:hypothetical protein [Vibrio parahaemolyticus]EJG2019043.1 hypothetical protein [Vibrio parahaemolyticus]
MLRKLLRGCRECNCATTVLTAGIFMSEADMNNEAEDTRCDNEQAESKNSEEVTLNGLLDLLEHAISTNTDKLVEVTEALKIELEEIIDDYQVGLDGKN